VTQHRGESRSKGVSSSSSSTVKTRDIIGPSYLRREGNPISRHVSSPSSPTNCVLQPFRAAITELPRRQQGGLNAQPDTEGDNYVEFSRTEPVKYGRGQWVDKIGFSRENSPCIDGESSEIHSPSRLERGSNSENVWAVGTKSPSHRAATALPPGADSEIDHMAAYLLHLSPEQLKYSREVREQFLSKNTNTASNEPTSKNKPDSVRDEPSYVEIQPTRYSPTVGLRSKVADPPRPVYLNRSSPTSSLSSDPHIRPENMRPQVIRTVSQEVSSESGSDGMRPGNYGSPTGNRTKIPINNPTENMARNLETKSAKVSQEYRHTVPVISSSKGSWKTERPSDHAYTEPIGSTIVGGTRFQQFSSGFPVHPRGDSESAYSASRNKDEELQCKLCTFANKVGATECEICLNRM